ncbi:hypothetical protein A8L45_09055 [Veronia pacifica]|uniref:Uncharacterized protein n=1 Tax=Veronia pacifica TaxID=1080227 RepID=A0A1C3EKL6_9GAMM|nr:hypothetical protein A8L45_09055 [Veronia pacifica]
MPYMNETIGTLTIASYLFGFRLNIGKIAMPDGCMSCVPDLAGNHKLSILWGMRATGIFDVLPMYLFRKKVYLN